MAKEVSGWTQQIPPDEARRFQYRIRPYLGNAKDTEMEARLQDVLRNIYCFTAEGKIGMCSPERGDALWMQKLIDLQMEFARRGQDIGDHGNFETLPWTRQALDLIGKNTELSEHVSKGGMFCKYGEEEWLRPLINEGRLRLSPASYYRAEEHNVARQDDELVLSTYITPHDYDLGFIPNQMLRLAPNRGWHVVRQSKPSDHLIYCITVGFDFRFFLDFGQASKPAKACLIIKDQAEFDRRLTSAARKELPAWWIRFDSVRYVDPYTLVRPIEWAGEEIYFFKPFRYMYQCEHRLVAVPPQGTTSELTHTSLQMGPLLDIAELVTINT